MCEVVSKPDKLDCTADDVTILVQNIFNNVRNNTIGSTIVFYEPDISYHKAVIVLSTIRRRNQVDLAVLKPYSE